MALLDAHCHFWRLSRGDYGWLEGTGGGLDPIRRDFLPADYPGDARLIVVQAAPSTAETEFLLDLARSEPRIAGVVGWVDMADPEAPGTLRRLADDPAFKGIRPMLQDIPDTDWLRTEARAEAFEALTELGLRFDALVTTRHLPVLAEIAARHPDLPVIVDHAAKPQPGARGDWEAGMKALADLSQVHCKLSGLMTELSEAERADPLPALRAIFEPLLDWFGPERLVWGSDWPVLTLAASWDDWRRLSGTLLADLPESDRAAILRGNGERFYGVTA